MNVIIAAIVGFVVGALVVGIVAWIIMGKESRAAQERENTLRRQYWDEREVNAAVTCRGWKEDSTRCRQTLGLDEHGFCRAHKDQYGTE